MSSNTGAEPIWAKNGRELYYLEGARLMAVAVDTRGDFSFKPPVQLFDTGVARGGSQPPSYDVAADGRFLIIKPANPRNTATALTVIANWTEKLRPVAR